MIGSNTSPPGFSNCMKLDDLFYEFLSRKEIALKLPQAQANSLRVSLIRKFKDYKTQAEKLGWLTDDLAVSSVSLEWSADGTAKFFLRPKRRVSIDYTLLENPANESPTQTTD